MYTTHAQPFQKTPKRKNRRVQQRRAAGMTTRSCPQTSELPQPVEECAECADGTSTVPEYRTDAERNEQIEALENSNPALSELDHTKALLAVAKEHGAQMAKLATQATNERIQLEDQIRTDEPIRKKLKEDNKLLLQHTEKLHHLYEQKEIQYNALVVKTTHWADRAHECADMADDVLRATMATRMIAQDTTPDMQRAPNNQQAPADDY